MGLNVATIKAFNEYLVHLKQPTVLFSIVHLRLPLTRSSVTESVFLVSVFPCEQRVKQGIPGKI
jgi:hypothetical protein